MVRFDAVLADVGGVFLLPHEKAVGEALAAAAVNFGAADFVQAHYRGITTVDRELGAAEDKQRYLEGYVEALGIPECDQARARMALLALWGEPSVNLWRQLVPESIQGLRLLEAHCIPVAIVSNSDGTVEEQLHRHAICQVGPGAGVTVRAIIDSAVVGVAKPDPRVFDPAIAAVGFPPDQIAFIGDSVRYDLVGAEAAGLVPVHFDPLRFCSSSHQHHHIRAIADLFRFADLTTTSLDVPM